MKAIESPRAQKGAKDTIAEFVQSTEAQKFAASVVGVAAGFIAKKLLKSALKRTPWGVAVLVVEAGIAAYISRHPEMVTNLISKFYPAKNQSEQ